MYDDIAFPFTSQIDEKESIFVPAGFDSLELIESLSKLKLEDEGEDEERKTENQKEYEEVVNIAMFNKD